MSTLLGIFLKFVSLHANETYIKYQLCRTIFVAKAFLFYFFTNIFIFTKCRVWDQANIPLRFLCHVFFIYPLIFLPSHSTHSFVFFLAGTNFCRINVIGHFLEEVLYVNILRDIFHESADSILVTHIIVAKSNIYQRFIHSWYILWRRLTKYQCRRLNKFRGFIG